jgi:hypothetical protein
MKRDFLETSQRSRLLQRLRKLTVGTAIAAVGLVTGGSAIPQAQSSPETVSPVIVQKSQKTPKLLLKLTNSKNTLSASQHQSHSSHSSHSSHRSHRSHYSGA